MLLHITCRYGMPIKSKVIFPFILSVVVKKMDIGSVGDAVENEMLPDWCPPGTVVQLWAWTLALLVLKCVSVTAVSNFLPAGDPVPRGSALLVIFSPFQLQMGRDGTG